jgi:uncharacterized membrane protein
VKTTTVKTLNTTRDKEAMGNKLRSFMRNLGKNLGKSLLLLGLVLTLTLSHSQPADAAYSGGRMGGGSFRMPSRSYSAPRTYAPSRGYGGGYGGGGFGFPFLLPFFGFGGGFGGLFSILIFMAVASFLVQSFRRIVGGAEDEAIGGEESPTSAISVAKVQVGLLANARNLQQELDQLAKNADTATTTGRAQVLQETTLALLRHPEYWAYGTTEAQKTSLLAAEAKFNQLALGERSKFSKETLSNFNSQLQQASLQKTPEDAAGDLANLMATPGEYIVVTLIVGATGKLELPKINGAEDLRQALRQIGAVGSDRLLAIEILWTPQALGDTLTTDDVMAGYPDLKVL